MKVDKDLINSVAKVARLNLTEEEIQRFIPQLKEVLDAFSKLDEVDISDISPSFQPIVIRNALREDKVTPSLDQKDALSLSKHTKDGYFKGPRAV